MLTEETYVQRFCKLNGSPLFVIPDVHGQIKTLGALVEKLLQGISFSSLDYFDRPRFLFLGDLVDKGFSSLDVIDNVHDLAKHFPVYVIKGNHEAKFLKMPTLKDGDNFDPIPEESKKKLESLLVLKGYPLTITKEESGLSSNFTFVHGGFPLSFKDKVWSTDQGIKPYLLSSREKKRLDRTRIVRFVSIETGEVESIDPREPSWEKPGLRFWADVWPLGALNLGVVIFGHQPFSSPVVFEQGGTTVAIGLDTACYKGNPINALVLSPEGTKLVRQDCLDPFFPDDYPLMSAKETLTGVDYV